MDPVFAIIVIAFVTFLIIAYPASRYGNKKKKVMKFMLPNSLSHETRERFIQWQEKYIRASDNAQWCLYSIPLGFVIPIFWILTIVWWIGSVRKFEQAQKIARSLGFTDKQAMKGTAIVNEISQQ